MDELACTTKACKRKDAGARRGVELGCLKRESPSALASEKTLPGLSRLRRRSEFGGQKL